MNTHIFTDREIKLLTDWMTGTAERAENTHLHVTLNRLRANEKKLTHQIHIYSLAIRMLHHGRLRKRADDLDTILTIEPIQLRPHSIAAYTLCLPKLREAQKTANDNTEDTEQRLEAAQLALEIAQLMIKDQKTPTSDTTT